MGLLNLASVAGKVVLGRSKADGQSIVTYSPLLVQDLMSSFDHVFIS